MLRKKGKPIAVSMRFAIICISLLTAISPIRADELAADLPSGVHAVWDLNKAQRDATATRERVCINGLWRWQPASKESTEPPSNHWGFIKVPGCWPGISDYLERDCQTLYVHPAWKSTRLAGVTAAWYEREIDVPTTWKGRRIAVNVEYLNSLAKVCVDGKPAGVIRFPGSEIDVTSLCTVGKKHRLGMLVVAMPLREVILSYKDTATARQERATVARRGLCGDVFLVSTPAGARVGDVRVETSVSAGRIRFDASLIDLSTDGSYALRATVSRAGTEVAHFDSKAFRAEDLRGGRNGFDASWKPKELWDIHTPGNVFSVSVSLIDARRQVVDASLPERFGFRELTIRSRDFFLNGTRIFLSCVPLDNAQIGAAWASYEGAKESLLRLKKLGINFVYTHNYGCEPGSHLGFAEVLRAADDVGMLVSFSQPHFSHYDWKVTDANSNNGYRRHAEYYTRMAANHPSVVFYSMSHNATGYNEDMNPDLIDGLTDPRETWAQNNANLALRAEAIVRSLDPGRTVYHHSSGNLGSMHTANFYPNFVPIQELSEWFEHWATKGVKPVFTCEYGAPFTWDWAMYRGWYKGQRSFGSARVPWEFCFAEWNAQFLGDRAYWLSESEKANLRWEAQQFRADRLWHRWDYPYEIGSDRFDDRHEVIGLYLTDNWRAFRTWGVSAISPWEHGHFWRLRAGVNKRRKDLPVHWNDLQRPGFSADYIDQPYERVDLAYNFNDWNPTRDGQALIRNNQPLLAYIAGKPSRFTSKDHNAWPGETVEKQIIIINNSRETVTCDAEWTLPLPSPIKGNKRVSVPTGQQERIPLKLELPPPLPGGQYQLAAAVKFNSGPTQRDTFAIDVMPPAPSDRNRPPARIALFDPRGETAALFESLKVPFEPVGAAADVSGYELFVVGKGALSLDGPAPRIGAIRSGLKTIVFEQTTDALEKRLGFRVTEYGLRQVFPRLSDHPILKGVSLDNLHDWRGASTIASPKLDYEMRPRYGPTVRWCDIPVTRVWRCGNQGNVASVLIEKPACGSFLPIVDGGFSLQYSPLMEYREGRGLVLFCQLDVTGRTETDPAAEKLVRNIIDDVLRREPLAVRNVVYAGEPAGFHHLELSGAKPIRYEGGKLSVDQVLVVGPGGAPALSADRAEIAEWLEAGGNLLALGLDAQEANSFLPIKVRTRKAEHIAAVLEPFESRSLFAGIGSADVHNRDPRELPLVTAGAAPLGDGILAKAENYNIVFCQLAPWHFEYHGKPNIKRTFRHTSFLVSRLLGNMGVNGATPVVDRFSTPVKKDPAEHRWREGLYLDDPEESDDPYRFFRW